MSNSFPYTSIHDYLDEQFGHLDHVSPKMIQEAKRRYLSLYNKWYKAKYRKIYTDIAFTVTKQQNAQIRQSAQNANQSIGKYIKNVLLSSHQKNNPTKYQYLTLEIAKVIDHIEAIIHNHPQTNIDLKPILSQLETIQNTIQQ